MTVQEFFNQLNNGSTWSAGVAFKRSNPLPLDKYSVFQTEGELSSYITSNAVAYPGQIVAVYNSTKETMKAYVINSVGAGGTYQAISGDLFLSGDGDNCIQQANTGTFATGTTVFAVGKNTTAVGNNATIEGGSSISAQDYSDLTFEYDENAEEDINFEGILAKWDAAHNKVISGEVTDPAEAGLFAISWGNNTHVEGLDCIASLAGHAEGRRTKAIGKRAHSEGTDTAATGSNSHVEGQDSLASGNVAHTEGYGTEARGPHSHAEGVGTIAIAQTSHAEGNNTQTKTAFSHAEGNGTIAAGIDAQHVQGRYNIEDTDGKYAHILGWGTSSTRKNIHTIDTSGNAVFAGDVTAKGISLSTVNTTASNATTRANSAYNLANEKPGRRQKWTHTTSGATLYADIMNGSDNTVLGGDGGGNRAFIAGYANTVNKDHGMALGVSNTINNQSAIALGTGLVPMADQQVVVGIYNNPDSTISDAVFVVGNGSYNGSVKSNGLVVKKNGTTVVKNLNAAAIEADSIKIDSIECDGFSCATGITIGNTYFSENQLKKILAFIENIEIGGNA